MNAKKEHHEDKERQQFISETQGCLVASVAVICLWLLLYIVLSR